MRLKKTSFWTFHFLDAVNRFGTTYAILKIANAGDHKPKGSWFEPCPKEFFNLKTLEKMKI